MKSDYEYLVDRLGRLMSAKYSCFVDEKVMVSVKKEKGLLPSCKYVTRNDQTICQINFNLTN